MDTKTQILQGATELFMRYGIKSITMDDLSRHLSMSKKTIYQYYTDKGTLVLETVLAHQNKQKYELERIFETSENVLDEVMKLSEYLKNMTTQMHPSLLYDLRKYHPAAYKAFLEHKRSFIVVMIKRTLQKGIQQKLFRKDLNMEILAKMRVEQIEMSFNPEVFPIGEFDLADIHQQLFEHFIYGICTIEGHKRLDELKASRKITNH